MARFEDHCFVDERHIDRAFPHVHRWLDEFAVKLGNAHRRERHHLEGVEEVRERWGSDAARAAELHILVDMGHIPGKADWEQGGVQGKDGEFATMDGMGILDDAVVALPSGIIVANASGYSAVLACSGCNDDTRQFLADIRAGEFRCAVCRGSNLYPDYRIR